MADTKISALTSGNPAQSGDEIPIARAGANYKITAGSIASLAAPAGSSGQLQYNNTGAFGGTSGLTTTGTELTIASGTKTASAPVLDITQTWNNAAVTFTGLKANVTDTASAAGSLLADLQVGGVSRFQVRKAGSMSLVTDIGAMVVGTDGTNNYTIQAYQGATKVGRIGFNEISNNIVIAPYANTTTMFSGSISIGNGAAADTILARDAADTLAQRRATNAQTLRVYKSYTDASNYSRLAINNNQIASEAAGTGTLEVTASAPVLNLAQTWNNAAVTFTGLKFNVTDTASAANSLLMDLQAAGATIFSVKRGGGGQQSTLTLRDPVQGTVSVSPSSGTWNFAQTIATTSNVQWGNGWGSLGGGNGNDVTIGGAGSINIIAAPPGNVWEQRRGTNAQTLRVYNTYTDASNYERAKIAWDTNVLKIGTEKAGTGTARALELQTDGTTRVTVGATSGIVNVGPTSTGITNLYGASAPRIQVSQAASTGIAAENTEPSGSGAGAFVGLYSNDGAAMTSGDRLGGFFFGGSSAANTLRNAAIIQGFANENWVDGSAYGSRIEIGLTPNGSTTRATYYTFAPTALTLADAVNIAVNTTTGTKIGTATTQKLSFWNATPIVQPTTAIAAATVAATGTGDVVAATTTFDGYTIPQIVKALRNAGLLA